MSSIHFIKVGKTYFMKNERVEQVILAQKKYLSRLNSSIDSILRDSPKANLNIHKRNGVYRFELRSSGDEGIQKSSYISRQSGDFQVYSSRYCATALKPIVSRCLSILERKPEDYDSELITSELERFEEIFGDDIPTCFETKKHYMKRWQEAEYRKNPYPFDPAKSYLTEQKEIVRSKNELLCANYVHSRGLLYRVDAEIRLKSGRSRYPDLIILNPRTLREEYHEIMGKMSDPEYVDENIIKLREYEDSGFYIGDRLHIYFESDKIPFDFEFFKSEISRLYPD